MSRNNTTPDAGANAPVTGTNTTPDAGANAPVTGTNTTPDAGVTPPVTDTTRTVNPPEIKKDEYEEVFIPKNGKGDDSLFVSVNGKRILIKKGEVVKVPKAHAEVIRNAMKQAAKNDEYIAANSKE